ncbi:MAG: NAD-binding protein [Clostridiales bacterium]|jgi:trk system potassium uptake protein TrkA|nr:NAD-binding protein [Clostridiales bacterium]
MKKRVFLIGGFSKAKALAASLIKKGYGVTVINKEPDESKMLAEAERLNVYCGDGTVPIVLENANIYGADIVIALTRNDDDNLVICQLCKKRFKVKKTVALVSDPKKVDFFYRMGIDSVVCAISAISAIIEQQAVMDEMQTLVSIGAGQIKISQIPVSPSAPAADKKLSELGFPNNVVIGCIMRGDRVVVPRGETRIHAGDILMIISADQKDIQGIKEITGNE